MEYSFCFKGKSVLLTGAASGIGLESTKAFIENEATVYMVDCNEEKLVREAENLKKKYEGCRVITITADITDSVQVENIVSVIRENTGSLDILVNNAGVSDYVYSINENRENWEKVININLTSQFFVAQIIAKEFFIPQNKGKIVNMCSLGGIMGIPGAAAYSASKGALLQLTKSLASEWARFGIQVNAVCPGFVDTPLIAENKKNEKWCNYMNMRTPMRRLANPDDIAGSVLFLSSHFSDFITGTSIIIDGGFSSGS